MTGDEYEHVGSEIGKMYQKDIGDGAMAFVEINVHISVSSPYELTGHEKDRVDKLEHNLGASLDKTLRDRGFDSHDGITTESDV